MTDARLALEPCSDGMFTWLADDPMPYLDLFGQIDWSEIQDLVDVAVTGEWL